LSAKVAITTASFAGPDEAPHRRLLAAGLEVLENPHGRRLTEQESCELLREAVGVLAGTSPLSSTVLAAAPGLRVISRCGVGMDSVDVDAAARAGISVYAAAGALPQSVAELAVGLMIAVLRRIGEADRQVRSGTWAPLMGSLLGTKTVGLVGLGRVGSRLAALLRAFGCRVIGADPQPPPPEVLAAQGIEVLRLDELLAVADIVSLHLPYTADVHHLVDARRLGLMRRGAILVNAARGNLVDEAALLSALESGALGGAALDVFADEPYRGPLAAVPNCVLTCHMGSYASECREAMEQEAVDNLLAGLVQAGVVGPGG
jgi:D-3-phosphoglycerate dehydrogenase / 2-oxoglutarate reductase